MPVASHVLVLLVLPRCAAGYYAGAYYLGAYRGAHTWDNFAASGALAGAGSALFMLRPVKARPIAFAALLGSALGASSGFAVQALGQPFWEDGHDFEGYFFGQAINLKIKAAALEQQQQQQSQSQQQAQPQQ
jgi:hypothetical protein